jgi:curved DNA-binding protein CbpA
MGTRRDYYTVLDVPHSASAAEIHHAFRDLARKLHPDVNHSPDATREFQELNEAYQVLTDPALRAAYDRTAIAPSERRSKPSTDPHIAQGDTANRKAARTTAPLLILLLWPIISLGARVCSSSSTGLDEIRQRFVSVLAQFPYAWYSIVLIGSAALIFTVVLGVLWWWLHRSSSPHR